MIEKIHIIMSLFAAIVISIVSIIQGNDISSMCSRLIFTIILFFIFGIIVRSKLSKMFEEDLYDGLEIYNTNIEQEEIIEDEQEQNVI